MLPINNGETSPCSNISSNCIVWQGPDIPCIGLCHGDTISDVIAKLAEQLCDLLDQSGAAEPDLSSLDLLCVLPTGQSAPDTVADTMQLIIDYVCDIQGSPESSLPTLNLPECLHYDTELGEAITALPLDQYALLLATKVCDILSSIELINTTILDHETRIIALEDCVLPCTDTVDEIDIVSSCIIPGTVAHSTLTLALETRYCSLEDAVGQPALIANAINVAGCITGSTSVLNGTGTYSSQSGWVNNPNTLAQSVQNAWVVLCDMYSAIEDIKDNCCPGACDSVVFAYTAEIQKSSTNIPVSLSVLFNGTSIPSGDFADCGGSTTVTVTDSDGGTVTQEVNVVALAGSTTSTNIPLAGLDFYDDLTVSVDFCITDGSNTCNEISSKVIPLSVPCPSDITATSITSEGLSVSFTNYLGTTASYVIQIINTATGLAEATANVTSPGTSVVQAITGLQANTAYQIKVTAQINGSESTCSTVAFSTLEDEVSCDEGIDIAIIMDYTGSMSNDISDAKSGAVGLITTVDNASGSNIYRFALVIADEVENAGTVAYSTNTEYTILPSSQKYVNTTGTPNSDVYITAMEMFGNDNGTTYQAQLNKLDNTLELGQGYNTPEPTDRALDLIINNNFVGAFRSDVAKYVVIITDALPSGLDDLYNNPGENDDAFISTLQATCIAEGIKIIVLGTGASNTVWQNLATNTGGSYDTSFDASSIASAITNLCGGSSGGGGGSSSTIYTIQSCSGTGTVYNAQWPDPLTVGQSVKLSADGGASCYQITGTTTSATNSTILSVYNDCNACAS